MTDIRSFFAEFQTREVAGTHCAICGREYTADDYKADSGLRYLGNVTANSRSAHDECFNGFTRLCDLYDLPWHKMRGMKA